MNSSIVTRHASEGRSVNAEVVRLLEQAVGQRIPSADLDKLYRKIRASRRAIARRHGPATDSAEVVRQMREERAKARG